jgi:hypothetical protein
LPSYTESMKTVLLVLCVLALGFVSAITASVEAQTQNKGTSARNQSVVKDGDYVGLEKMPNLSPDDRDARWFHENTLIIRNDEAILENVPITIRHGQKSYSASDGGFLTYRARFARKDGLSIIQMRLFKSDYVIFPSDKHDQYTEIKEYPVTLGSDQIEFAGVRYKPSKVEPWKLNLLLPLLGLEPLEASDANLPPIIVDSMVASDYGELRTAADSVEKGPCGGHYGYLEPTTVSDYVGGSVKAIRLLRSAPLMAATRLGADEVQQKISLLWLGKFRGVSCRPMWAEGNFWSLEAVVEFEDGRRSRLFTDGVHVALQDHNGNSAFFRLFPAAQ